jgi:non-ribosomal peptide synthetase component F
VEELEGVLASTSICFDLSIFELFVPLSWGGRVLLAETALELPEVAGRGAVRLINTVPSAMAELVRGEWVPETVRVVNLAGEALSASLVEQLYQLPWIERVVNLYGPTEDTTYSTWGVMRRGEVVTIGRPVAQTEAYVVDGGGQLVPVGVVGELYLGGAGLARGYLKRAGLTAERFVPDGFSGGGGRRLYRTGDLVRYLGNGRLEYVGRSDQQVKLRGYRIELGEIESVLSRHGKVREAVVEVSREGSGQQRLVAYVVGENGSEAGEGELRRHLREYLPEHMVPSAWVRLEHLPLTPNGKVDRRCRRRRAGVWKKGAVM